MVSICEEMIRPMVNLVEIEDRSPSPARATPARFRILTSAAHYPAASHARCSACVGKCWLSICP